MNRHGVKTIGSCCGHGGPGGIVLAPGTVSPGHGGTSWLRLAPKPVVLPYCDDTGDWDDDYPAGGRNLSKICHELCLAEEMEEMT